MQEGRPRESLVLFDTPIEVSSIALEMITGMLTYNRSDLVLTQTTPSRNNSDVSHPTRYMRIKLTFSFI